VKISLIAKNFTALLGSNFGVQALRFLTIIILARRLGSTVFGVYNYILLLWSIGFTLTEFGLKNLAIRELAQGKGSQRLITMLFKLRIFLGLVSTAVLIGVMHFAFSSDLYLFPTLLIASTLIIDGFLSDFLLIAEEKLVAQATANILQAGIFFVGSYFFIHGEKDLTKLAGIYFLSHVIWVSMFWYSAHRIKKNLPVSSVFDNNFRSISLGGLPFLIAQFVGSIQLGMDLLLMGQFHFENVLGDYSAALKITGIMLGVVNALMGAVQPRLAKHTHRFDSLEMHELVANTTRIVWVFVIPMILVCWLIGDELVMWFFGRKYLLAATFLRPLSISVSLFCLGLAPMHALFVARKSKTLIRIALFNCLISFLTISGILYLGRPDMVGWGMVFVQAAYFLSAWSLFKFRDILIFDDLKFLLVPTILMLFPIFLISQIVIKVALIILAYAAGLALVKIWRRPWFKAILA
jgi:O-antigen/teichoic acid export membrane protein